MLNEKALEAARKAFEEEPYFDTCLGAAIRAYLAALPSSPVRELVERLRETHTCDGCGEYVGSIIHDLCDEADSTLTTLSTRNAELEREVKRLRDALGQIEDHTEIDDNLEIVLSDPAMIAREALSTSPQGGEHE